MMRDSGSVKFRCASGSGLACSGSGTGGGRPPNFLPCASSCRRRSSNFASAAAFSTVARSRASCSNAGLALVADALLAPAFPEEEVRKTLARRTDGLKTTKDNPGAAINSFYRSFFFGSAHPYGRPADEASYDRIRRQDIVDYHQKTYVGRNLIVIVAGDFDPAAAKARVTQTFGAVPSGAAYTFAAAPAA